MIYELRTYVIVTSQKFYHSYLVRSARKGYPESRNQYHTECIEGFKSYHTMATSMIAFSKVKEILMFESSLIFLLQ